MHRSLRFPIRVLAFVVGAVLVLTPGLASASPPGRVIIVSIPGLTWLDVSPQTTPTIHSLAEEWSIAALSVRTVGSRTDPASAYLTLGAGNRARVAPWTVSTLSEDTDGSEIVGFVNVVQDNDSLKFGAKPGALGEALKQKGLKTGVVGNADGGAPVLGASVHIGEGRRNRRLASLALVDRDGRIERSATGSRLAVTDGSAANGFRTNIDALEEEFLLLLDEDDGVDVVLVEVADTLRESIVLFEPGEGRPPVEPDDPRPPVEPDDPRPPVGPDDSRRLDAITRDDSTLRRLLAHVNLEEDSLIVLAPSGIGMTERETLTVLIHAGVGSERGGWLTSPTTQRDGLVALTDVGPGILSLLGIEVPSSMTGQPMRAEETGETDRISRLVRIHEKAAFHDRWIVFFLASMVILQLVLYLGAWRLFPRFGPTTRSKSVRTLALVFMSVPAGTLVVALTDAHRWGAAAAGLLIFLTGLVMAGAALLGPWRYRPAGPAGFVCIVTASGFLLDVITGSTLQISSLFGYSPVVAGRFYGIGNLAFVIMGTSALLGLGVLLRPDGWKAGGIAVSVGVGVLLVDGHPSLGADLGGTLAIAPAFGATALMMAGRKVRWRTMILLCVAAAAAAFGIAYLDSLRDVSVQTHLGRFASTLIEGGMDAVRPIIMRKLEANVSVLTGSVLSLGVPIAGGFLFIWMRKRRDRLQALFAHEPGLRPAFVGMIVLNVVGFAVNDSGVPILAMGLALAVPFLLATVLSQDPGSKIEPGRV